MYASLGGAWKLWTTYKTVLLTCKARVSLGYCSQQTTEFVHLSTDRRTTSPIILKIIRIFEFILCFQFTLIIEMFSYLLTCFYALLFWRASITLSPPPFGNRTQYMYTDLVCLPAVFHAHRRICIVPDSPIIIMKPVLKLSNLISYDNDK